METEEKQETSTEELTEETTETTEAQETGQKEGESQDDYRARLNAQNRFLEKEGYEFKEGKWIKPKQSAPSQDQAFSPKDYLALRDANVSAEDFDEVSDFAKYKGISLAEALKQPVLKTILNERAEERKTAEATATRGSRRGDTKPNDEALLERASRGETFGEDSIAAIAKARHARNFKK